MTEATQDEPGMRAQLRRYLEMPVVQNGILCVIVFNAITLGLSTSKSMMGEYGLMLRLVDELVLGVFVIEMTLKLYGYGWRFFLSAWNIFDLSIVSISILPVTESLSVLRGLRVIRAMRILSAVPQMRAVIQALLSALPGMGAVIVVLGIVYYVFGVMATLLYGKSHPQWFGTLGESLYSLFQIMTLESWSMGIVRPVMEAHPNAWAFFVPFIVTTAFAVLNLFIGLLVNTMQAAVEEETEREIELLRELVREENAALANQIKALTEEIRSSRGAAT